MTNHNYDPIPKPEPTTEPIHHYRCWLSNSTFLDLEARDEPQARVRAYLLAPPGVVVITVERIPN